MPKFNSLNLNDIYFFWQILLEKLFIIEQLVYDIEQNNLI